MNGLLEDALMVFYSMIFDDYKPDYITVFVVLSACYHESLVNKGLSHFRTIYKCGAWSLRFSNTRAHEVSV